jgi:hypothetical protein
MNKRIKPKAEYSLEINGKTTKGSGVTVRQEVEEEKSKPRKKPRIIPKADYSVEINE